MSKKEKQLKLIKKGFHGNGNEYQYGEDIFILARTNGWTAMFKRPNINQGDQIFKGQRYEDIYPFLRRFKEFLKTEYGSCDAASLPEMTNLDG